MNDASLIQAPGSVIVVGSLNVDLVVTLGRLPDPGETVIGDTLERFPGGKGLNQAVAAARLGAAVHLVGAVGDDDTGAWLRGILTDEGIDGDDVHVASGPSGTALIEVDHAGRNRIVVIPGANDAITPAQAHAGVSRHTDAAVVLAQGETPIDTVQAAFAAARERSITTILNPAPARAFPVALYALVDILIPNEHEAALLTGLPTTNEDECVVAARALLARGCRIVLITRGEAGAVLATEDRVVTIPAFPVTPIDTVAAGDAFCGALSAALATGTPLDESVRIGCAAGALATLTAGAVPSLPRQAAVRAFLHAATPST